jgi:gliding motility-associated-like protein
MKSIKKSIYIILFILTFNSIAGAQCSFDFTAEAGPSTCVSNGTIKVTLSGDEIDLSNVLISIYNNTGVNEKSSVNGYQFGALLPGQYTVEAQSVCKTTQNEVRLARTVTVSSEYTGLGATRINSRSSLNCINSGMILIETSNGKLPYKMTMTSKPAAYTGETEFVLSSSGNYQFEELAPGDYVFTVVDACGYEKIILSTIDKLADDFPSDPYESYFYPACRQAYVSENPITYQTNVYWAYYRDFYEIAFVLDGSKNYESSTIYSNPQYISLTEAYRDVYASKKTVKVYLRLKGTECEKLVDEVQFAEPVPPEILSYNEKSCKTYNLLFYLNSEHTMCPPFKWELLNDANEVISSLDNIDYFGTQTMENLQYNTNYTLRVSDEDGNGTQVISKISVDQDDPVVEGYWPAKHFLFNYDLFYDVSQICMPYKIEVFDENDNPLATIDNLTSPSDNIRGLEYNKWYKIKVTDDNGKPAWFEYYEPKPEEFFEEGPIIYRCDDYSLIIEDPINVNVPYTWSVTDKSGATVAEGTDEDGLITNLQYSLAYTVKFTDGVNTASFTIPENSITRPKPYFFDISEYGYQCDDYEMRFQAKNFVCLPYKLEVLEGGKTVHEETFATPLYPEYHTVKLEYDKKYTIKITDSKGNPISYDQPAVDVRNLKPYFENSWIDNFKCIDYEFGFNVQNIICYPYEFEVFDGDGVSVKHETGFNYLQEHRVMLDYNKDYTITVTDHNGNFVSLSQRLDMEVSGISFGSSSYMSNCIAKSFSGFIAINGQLSAGTRIRFISGPQTPVYPDAILTESISWFYPFSQIYTNQEDVPIAAGNYVFEIIDAECGDAHTLNITHGKDMEVAGFTYIMDKTTDVCQGTSRVYPRGKIYDRGQPVSTWFVMTDAPNSSLIGMAIHDSDLSSFFTLSSTGRYVIEARVRDYLEEFEDCGVDTIVIVYEDNRLTVEGKTSYVCETGTIGHIRVQAKNGKLPYTYTLLDENSKPVPGIAPNNTGAFEYGAYGDNYIVLVQDACGLTTFPVDVKINTLDQMALMSGNTDFCNGEGINLSCLILGATEYEWSGPLGYSANTREISIPNVSAADAGEYTIRVKPAGCDKFFSNSRMINVHETPEPDISANVYLCNSNAEHRLSLAPADANHSIQWYDLNRELMNAEPVIDLNTVRNYTYYVTQTNDIFSCVTEKKVEVSIMLPPDKNANASGRSCAGEYPDLTVTDVVAGYVYTVYADAGATDAIMTFSGTDETMTVTLPVTVTDNTVFYLKTATVGGCTLSPGIVEFQVEVDKIGIFPEKLRVYTNGMPYSEQITSDAAEPVFSVEGSPVTGIVVSITETGVLISGTVPESAGREESTFTVTVTDLVTGCKASREYLMRTCGPAPRLLSDKVEYCEGATALPLQALPDEGYILKWCRDKDDELCELSEAPVPLTSKVGDEQVFYVLQRNEALACESEKTEIRVIINPAPVIDCKISANDVCFRNSPSILLEDLNEDFTYSIYSDKTFSNKLASVTGTNSDTVKLNEILEDGKTYYVTVSDVSKCASLNWQEVSVDVIKLYIEPESLPPYVKDNDYEQLLVSNAKSPAFTLVDGNLPEGLTLNTYGLIYGKAPDSYRDISNIISVEVRDLNGCIAVREYVFNGNIFIPAAFSPNGDGVNDIFMRGYRLVIFDRLGIIIFQGNNGWDGTYKGKPVADDIYFYKLEYINSEGNRRVTTGYVGVKN